MPKVTEEHREARRQQILEAALTCFANKGFHQTSIQDICKEAGLSPGAIYLYFPNKEEIIEASCQRDKQARALRFEEARQKNDIAQVLNELWDIYAERLNGADTDISLRISIQLQAEASRNPRIAEMMRGVWSDVAERLGGIISQAQKEGKVNPEVDCYAVARLYMALHDGLSIQKIVDPGMDMPKTTEAFRAITTGNFWQNDEEEGENE